MHSVVNDEFLLEAFHLFALRFHAQETLLFWLEVEVFRNRDWKVAKLLGLSETPRANNTRHAKTAAATRQQRLDQAEAKRMHISLEQLFLIKEADFVYDTFVAREAKLWTCLDAKTVRGIEQELFHGNPSEVSRGLFDDAQLRVFTEISDDLMPRFFRQLDETKEMSSAKQRYDELKSRPEKRKTQVSTALAFSFAKRASLTGSALKTGLLSSTRKSMKSRLASPIAENQPSAASPLPSPSVHFASLTPDRIQAIGLSKHRMSAGPKALSSTLASLLEDSAGVKRRASVSAPTPAPASKAKRTGSI